jgi:hypothetical protein
LSLSTGKPPWSQIEPVQSRREQRRSPNSGLSPAIGPGCQSRQKPRSLPQPRPSRTSFSITLARPIFRPGKSSRTGHRARSDCSPFPRSKPEFLILAVHGAGRPPPHWRGRVPLRLACRSHSLTPKRYDCFDNDASLFVFRNRIRVGSDDSEISRILPACPAAPKGSPPKRQPHEDPQLRTLTFNQASLFLVARAGVGHRGAQDLLRLVFPRYGEEPSERK